MKKVCLIFLIIYIIGFYISINPEPWLLNLLEIPILGTILHLMFLVGLVTTLYGTPLWVFLGCFGLSTEDV